MRLSWNEVDRAVDQHYKPSGFADDRDRVEHLFGLYEGLNARLPTGSKPKTRGRRQGGARSRADQERIDAGGITLAVETMRMTKAMKSAKR